jgi:hypothetical protein
MSLESKAGGHGAQDGAQGRVQERVKDRGRDRRAHPRFAVDEEAHMLRVGHGRSHECRVLDLSLEGCRLQCVARIAPPLQSRVEVTFTINGIPFRLGGEIQRSNGSGELGVRFSEMTVHRKAEWVEIVAEVQERAALRANRAAAREAVRTLVKEALRRGELGVRF